jgi:formyltetrahydrofolate deformylase
MRAATPEYGPLVLSCQDGPGIIAAISRFLADRGADIVHSDQHTTKSLGGEFLLREDRVFVAGSRTVASSSGMS